MRPTILHLFPELQLGGVPSVLSTFVCNCDRFDFRFACRISDEQLSITLSSDPRALSDIDLGRFSLDSLLKLTRLVTELRPDVIHAHGRGAALYSYLVTRWSNRKQAVVYTYHGFNTDHLGWKRYPYLLLERLFFKTFRYTIALSQSEYNKIIAARAARKTEKLKIVPNGISIPKHTALPRWLEPSLPVRFRVATIGRICPQKDLVTFVKAAAMVVQQMKDTVDFTVLGGANDADVDYEHSVKQLAKSLGISGHINFVGPVREASQFIHNFDAYVSTSHWEGLPTAVIEAMLSEVPVVVSDCVGNRDVVENGATGFVCGEQNAMCFARKIIETLRNDSNDRCIAARQYCESSYSVSEYISRLTTLYDQVISEWN